MQKKSNPIEKMICNTKRHISRVLIGILLIILIFSVLIFINIALKEGVSSVYTPKGKQNVPLESFGSSDPAHPTNLSDDIDVFESNSIAYYYYQTIEAPSTNYYHIIWLYFDSANDFDLFLYSDSAYTNLVDYSMQFTTPEWVIFRPNISQIYYPKAVFWTDTGWSSIEWEDSSDTIPIGGSASGSISVFDAIEIYQVSLLDNSSYTFSLDVPVGANFDLYLYYLSPGSSANASGYTQSSDSGGIGVDESISNYNPPISGNYSLIVVKRFGDGNFTLYSMIVQSLTEDVTLSTTYSTGSYYYGTATLASPTYYHVVWLNFDGANNFDLILYGDSGYINSLEESSSNLPEWVIFRPSGSQIYYPRSVVTSGSGWANIEWKDSSSSLSIGGSASASLNSSEAIEIYQISLNSGSTYAFTLDVPSNANYDLYLYYLSSGNTANSTGYTQASASGVNGTTESILGYTPSITGNYALLVVWRSGSGAFTLSTSGGTLTVTAPSGLSLWDPGENYPIVWTSTGNISFVKIELYKGLNFIANITTYSPNDGNYLWLIPSSISEGSDYRIKVTSTNDPNLHDFSDYFTITGPPIPGFEFLYVFLTFTLIMAFFFSFHESLNNFKRAPIRD